MHLKETGTASLTIRVPSGLIRFLKDLSAFGGVELDPKVWIENEAVASARAAIESIECDGFIQSKFLRQKYGLEERDC